MHIQLAIQAYYAERATPEHVEALEAWFREDDANIKIFAEHGMLEWQMLCEHEKQDAATILSILREAEDKADPDLVEIHHFSDPNDANWKTPWGRRGVLGSVSSYLMSEGLRSKFGVLEAVAAVLILGLILFLFFGGPGDSSHPPKVAENTLAEPRIDSIPIVATLTAERDAVWDSRPGEELYAGQRFTLLQGFAEITTGRGAVAILEAPAMLELLKSDNAIHLHAGKLVAICETESSKGFTVHTATLDITDLGTRFGVDADDRAAEVHVFEGAVTAIRPDALAGVKPTSIIAGESASTSSGTSQIVVKVPDTERFAAMQAPPVLLRGTAQRLDTIQPDSSWRLMTADGTHLDQPAAMFVAHPMAYAGSRDQSGDPLGPWWLQFHPAMQPTPQQPKVVHLIQSEFEFDASLDPETTQLVIACAADDFLKAIHINGNRVTELGTMLGRVHHLTIDQHLKAGKNTVHFEIENNWSNPGRNPIGLYVRWHLLPAAPSDGLREGLGIDQDAASVLE